MGFITAKESFYRCPTKGCDNIIMIAGVMYRGVYDGQVELVCGRPGHPNFTVTWPPPSDHSDGHDAP